MVTLENFETEVNEAIVKRGKKYYVDGAVTAIEETKKNYWEAEVEGTETYLTEVKIKGKNGIGAYDCDCGYDGICKHVIAVLFAIKDERAGAVNKLGTSKKITFEGLLKKINIEEYVAFISAYSKKHKDFKTEFELWFADKDETIDTGKKFVDLVRKIIAKHSDRGFIGYHETYAVAREVSDLTRTGYGYINKKNYKDAFALAGAVLKEMMQALTYGDDSNGSMSGTADGARELIEAVTNTTDIAVVLKEQIFDFLRKELSDNIYFDYGDIGYNLYPVFRKLAGELNKTTEFLQYIDGRLALPAKGYSDYDRNFFLLQKAEFLKASGREGEAEKLVQENMEVVELRQGEVDKAIGKKDFNFAKKLISDGIKIAQKKGHPGTVSSWEKQFLRIAVLEKDTGTVRYYTKKFAFDGWFDKEYYNAWKKTYSISEWNVVIEEYIAEITNKIKEQGEKNKDKYGLLMNPTCLMNLHPFILKRSYGTGCLCLYKRRPRWIPF